jgi:thiol:disulfide interchange protein
MKKIFWLTALVLLSQIILPSCANSVKNKDKKSKETEAADDFSGIKFVDLSFEEALVQSKKQKKMIFIDAYASWCGPCKMLDRNTFPDRSVGTYFNDKFINFYIIKDKN